MTKTYKEIYYSILESLSDFNITDDNKIAKRFLIKKIADVNLRLVEEVKKQGLSLDNLYQRQCCIEIKCDKLTCNGEETGEVVWYSDISSLNPKVGWDDIKFLGVEGQPSFRRLNYSSFTNGNQFEYSKKTIYTVVGNKIYYKDLPTEGIKYICMVSLQADPVTICNWNDSMYYPTPDPYKLELMVKNDILATYPKMPDDEQQDSRANEPIQQPAPSQQQQPQ